MNKHESQPKLYGSPHLKQQQDATSSQGVYSINKKRSMITGHSHAVLAARDQNPAQNPNNYNRIANIYNVNSYKNKRKSHAPDARMLVASQIVPQMKGGPYEDSGKRGD